MRRGQQGSQATFLLEKLKTGKHQHHKPRKRFKDNLRDNRNGLNMNVQHWEELTLNRTSWRQFIREGWMSQTCSDQAWFTTRHSLPTNMQSCHSGVFQPMLVSRASDANHLNGHLKHANYAIVLPTIPVLSTSSADHHLGWKGIRCYIREL